MKSFNVLTFDVNTNKVVPYDIMPYLIRTYNEVKEKKYKPLPTTFEEFRKFVQDEAKYQWWSRCEYEIILVDWPCKRKEEKWDVYGQVILNLDIVTNLLMENLNVA